jgi:nuclear cap-binding protein subunit 1
VSTELDKDIPDFKFRSDGMCGVCLNGTIMLTALVDALFAKEANEIVQLIKGKGGQDEMQAVIDSIESQAAALDVDEPLLLSTDVFVTSICFVGAKSLSHFLSCIERCKDKLLALGPRSPAARRQIITSVMEYWKFNPGIGVNIIDKLLNYTILTPMSVIEWALTDKIDRGRALAKHDVYEMVSTTMGKVTNRVRQVLAATRHPGLPEDQVKILTDTLDRERQDMADLFKVIVDVLVSVADGNSDVQMDNGYGDTDEEKLVQDLGRCWLRVFKRKISVEDTFIAEVLASKPDVKAEMETTEGNSARSGNGVIEREIS